MRVAIVDDHVLLREGLARLLAEAGMEVVASEGDMDGFLRETERSHPDVAIIDIRLPPTFTDEGLRAADLVRARHPGAAVLVLSQYLNAGYALRLLESFPSGVGYLLKDRVSQVAVLRRRGRASRRGRMRGGSEHRGPPGEPDRAGRTAERAHPP
jgi:DNA-binding NarL/FixJ family response regulator